jgi:peptidoglycan/LPS O-acetylase OafA/YrhL
MTQSGPVVVADPIQPAKSDAAAIKPLTGLRLFAALYVLLLHSGSAVIIGLGVPGPVYNFLRGGQLGVSFFFVLSGFILTYTYESTRWDRRALSSYGWARVARIVPLYLLSLLIALPFFVKVFSTEWAVASLLFVQSWVPASMFGGTPWNGLAWTLSVEAFFYLSLPAWLLLTRRWTTTGLVGGLLVTWALMVALRLPTAYIDAEADAFAFAWMYDVPFMLLRVPEFVSGILLAGLFLRHRRALPDTWLVLALTFTIAALAVSTNAFARSVAAIGFGLVIVTAACSVGRASALLGSKFMLLMGGASYGIYLFQGVLHQWVSTTLGDGAIGDAAFWPLCLLFSIAAFVWFEEPARARIRQWRRR